MTPRPADLPGQLGQGQPGLGSGRHAVIGQDRGILAGQRAAGVVGPGRVHVALAGLQRVRDQVGLGYVHPELPEDVLN